MSEWLTKFENHQIHDDIRSALTPAEEIKASADELEPDALERVDRIVYVLSELKRRLQCTDPNLIPAQPLKNLHNPLSQIAQQLSLSQSNKDEYNIQQAHNQLENVLVHLAQIPMPTTTADMEAIREAAVALRRSAGQHMRHVEEEGQSALRELQSLRQDVKALKETVDQSTSETHGLSEAFREEFDEAEQSRQKQAAAHIEERKAESDTALEEKTKEWDGIIEARETEYEELYDSIKQRIADAEDEFRKKTDAILANIAQFQTDAERIVGVITDTGMVGGYQRVANSEMRAALFWRIIALLGLFSLVGFAIFLFKTTLRQDFEVTTALTFTRGFVGLSVAILAGYAARQADKHQRSERRHRKMELELATIATYLSKFPEEEARKIKTDLAMKMFAQQDVEPVKEGKQTTNSAMNLAGMALESLQSLIGKQ